MSRKSAVKATVPLLFALALAGAFGTAHAAPPHDVISLNVSGYPVCGDTLKDFVLDSILDSLKPDSGQLIFADLKAVPSKIAPGKSVFIDAPIKFSDRGGATVKKHLYIVAYNLGIERTGDSRLMISNDPEEIGKEGLLLSEKLSRGEAVRLLYYHRAAAGKRFELSLALTNPNSYPIDIFVAKGIGGPCPDGIYAGHVATERFMEQEIFDAGRIIKVAPLATVSLSDQEVREAEVSTAIIKLRQLSGDGAIIKLSASDSGIIPAATLSSTNLKEDGRLSGTINQGQIDVHKNFSFGQNPVDIRIGEGPAFLSESGGFDMNLGNYGILHRISLSLVNGSSKERTASLFYVATGGPARGVFIIDGALYETGLLDPKGNKSQKITSISVPPNGSRALLINMMPEPGSFYPTRLVLLEEKP